MDRGVRCALIFAAIAQAACSFNAAGVGGRAMNDTGPSPSATDAAGSADAPAGGADVGAVADSGQGLDAAPLDAAPLDAAPLDAAPVDAAPVDAAPLDAAPSPMDANMSVSGDAAAPDASGPCGGENQACCAGSTPCDTAYHWCSTGICTRCIEPGDKCCPPDSMHNMPYCGGGQACTVGGVCC